MKTIEPENRKYFNKFGVTNNSINWREESTRPLARCSICIELFDGGYKTDKLVLETRYGKDYLCCDIHRRRDYGRQT